MYVYTPEHPMHLVTSRALLTFCVSAGCCIPLEYPFLYLLGCEVVHISHQHVHVTVQTGNDNIIVCTWGPPQIHCASMKNPTQSPPRSPMGSKPKLTWEINRSSYCIDLDSRPLIDFINYHSLYKDWNISATQPPIPYNRKFSRVLIFAVFAPHLPWFHSFCLHRTYL